MTIPDGRRFFLLQPPEMGGTLEQIQQTPVERTRKKAGRKAEPSAAVIDAQSAKTTLVAGKKVKGRKLHIVIDTLELILTLIIESASVQDSNGADEVIRC